MELTMLEHHPLVKEFPEHAQTIHELKASDNRFDKLFNEYDDLDKTIFRIEANQESITDHDLTDLKKQRRRVKDMLYNTVLAVEKSV